MLNIKTIIITIGVALQCTIATAQLDANALVGLSSGTTTEMNGITTPNIGSLLFNTTDDAMYIFTAGGWVTLSSIYNSDGQFLSDRTIDMNANQFNLETDADSKSTLTLRRTNNANETGIAFRNSGNAYDAAIVMGTPNSGSLDFYSVGNATDINSLGKTLAMEEDGQLEFSQYGAGTFDDASPARLIGVQADGDVVEINPSSFTNTDDQTAAEVNLVTNVDSNGDTTDETNLEAVVQAITPITSKAGRVFYPPSIAIDASTTGTGRIINLYQEYVNQFAPGAGITSRSTGAPSTIPVYASNELYYYVTAFDPAVFTITNISNTGVMTYNVVGVPSTYNSLINVVFVVQ